MTKFNRDFFNTHGGYVTYCAPGSPSRFVARFKYGKDGMAGFISFLIKNLSVEAYFDHYDAGNAPLEILQHYGYETPMWKRGLKNGTISPELQAYHVRRIAEPLKVKAPVVAPAVSAQQAFVEAILAA